MKWPGYLIGTPAVKDAEAKAIKRRKRCLYAKNCKETTFWTLEDFEKPDYHVKNTIDIQGEKADIEEPEAWWYIN